jgi:methyl-accepting chemotaxis protein
MKPESGYPLQRTMIIYFLLIGVAAVTVAAEFVLETHSTALKQQLEENHARYTNGSIDQDSVYAPLLRIRKKAMLMVGVILAVVIIVLTMFIKTITEPLQHLVEVAKAISAGDLRRTARVATRNELAQLSTAIDDMSSNLQEIIMLSRSVCNSAGRVTTRTLTRIGEENLTHDDIVQMEKELVCLLTELETLGRVIDYFKLYSVDKAQ